MQNYFVGIAVLFFSGLVTLLFKSPTLKLKTITLGAIFTCFFTLSAAIQAFSQQGFECIMNFGTIFQSVRFVIDNLSAFFIAVISIMSTLAIIYANGYLKPYIEKGKDLSAHCVFLPMLMCSMLLVVTIQNALVFLIVWELMSLSSFFLVIFENDKKEVLNAGIKYLIYMHISVIFIILYFTVMSINASSLDFYYFKSALENNAALANTAFILAFIGFGIKAGFVPFHNWLSDAHPAAPSHVSGMMSGVMIKTGIYGILRTLTFINEPCAQIGFFVLIISTISALYGVLYAISQHDLKRLLAYHSIENIGIIGIGIGVGMLGLTYHNPIVATLGFAGGILHVLNHSIFKELLFLAAGSVYFKTHTRNIEILGGLIKSMPKTALLFLVGSVAICGLPPFNGFISEFFIYFAMLKGLLTNNISMFLGMILALSGLALVGTMAILCFTKAFSIIFLGEKRSECAQKATEDSPAAFIFPMSVLAIFTLIIGIFPSQVLTFMMFPLSNITSDIKVSNFVFIAQDISYIALSLIAFIIVLFIVKLLIQKTTQKHTTWGCGYNKPTSAMQYSASSYASPFITMLTPLFKRVVDIKKPKVIFSKDAHFSLHMEDVEEAYFLKPFIKATEKFFAKFEKIQNGNIQSYILYGLVFLILSLIGVVILG